MKHNAQSKGTQKKCINTGWWRPEKQEGEEISEQTVYKLLSNLLCGVCLLSQKADAGTESQVVEMVKNIFPIKVKKTKTHFSY